MAAMIVGPTTALRNQGKPNAEQPPGGLTE
jgi:hypothetical protein